jgi:hypothetical protein
MPGTPDEEIRGRLRKYVGLTASTPTRLVETPYRTGAISVDHATIEHILGKRDADHLGTWPLALATLAEPLEIWQAPPEADKPRKLQFIALYHVGNQLINHMVIVDDEQNRVITGYKLDLAADPNRAEKRRTEIPHYLVWVR